MGDPERADSRAGGAIVGYAGGVAMRVCMRFMRLHGSTPARELGLSLAGAYLTFYIANAPRGYPIPSILIVNPATNAVDFSPRMCAALCKPAYARLLHSPACVSLRMNTADEEQGIKVQQHGLQCHIVPTSHAPPLQSWCADSVQTNSLSMKDLGL